MWNSTGFSIYANIKHQHVHLLFAKGKMKSNNERKNKPLAADISIWNGNKTQYVKVPKIIAACKWVWKGEELGEASAHWRERWFLTCTFNEPNCVLHYCSLYCSQHRTPALYSVRMSEPLDILYQHLAQHGSSFSVTAISKQHVELHNSQLVPTGFWTFGDASRNLFPPFIIRLLEAMSHGWMGRMRSVQALVGLVIVL